MMAQLVDGHTVEMNGKLATHHSVLNIASVYMVYDMSAGV